MARATRTQTKTRGAAGPRRYEHGQDAVARPELPGPHYFPKPRELKGADGMPLPQQAGDRA
jgi:hypothetical protein